MKGLRAIAATGHVSARPTGFDLGCGAHDFSVLAWGDGIMGLNWQDSHPLPDSPAVIAAPDRVCRFDVQELLDGWRISLPALSMRVTTHPFTVSWRTPSGEALWGPVMVGLGAAEGAPPRKDQLVVAGPLRVDDAFYGLGEKPGHLDRRGRTYTMWNTDQTGPHLETDDALYASIPFLITCHGGRFAGFLFDDPGRTTFDLGAHSPNGWHFKADSSGLRLFVLAGPTLAEVLARYVHLTGRMPLPPKWSLGYHQSRWSYGSRLEVEAIAAQLRLRGIPADAIHLDIDYMDGYRVFTWDEDRFPDPAAMHASLAAANFRTVAIVDPGIKVDPGFDVYDDCRELDFNVRLPDGRPYVGRVWPGDCVFPDFTREPVRTWWGEQHRFLLEEGVSGIWNDMNEPSVFRAPDLPRQEQTMPPQVMHGTVQAAGLPHRKAHNLYGLAMCQATHLALRRLRPNERPFVLTRSGFAGIQRYAAMWTGDNHSAWSHLDQAIATCLGLGLSGVPFVGADVGGFAGDTTGELLIRWTQAGALMPFFRNHSAKGTRPQEPWALGPMVEAHCRAAIELRYRLLPYLYTAFQQATQSGLPVMRPLLLHDGDDPLVRALDDQFFCGADLLVAPVTRPGATHRLVYIPHGTFYDFHTGQAYEGPAHHVIETPLDRLPLFARGGAVIPVGPVIQHADEPITVLNWQIYPGSAIAGGWYDDDGISPPSAVSGANDWRWVGEGNDHQLTMEMSALRQGYDSPTRQFRLVFPAGFRPRNVTWQSRDLPEQTDRSGGHFLAFEAGELVISLEP